MSSKIGNRCFWSLLDYAQIDLGRVKCQDGAVFNGSTLVVINDLLKVKIVKR